MSETTTTTATYTKLRTGAWGIRVVGPTPTAGQTVTVTKRDGARKSETIDRVVWAGDNVALCSIVPTAKPAAKPARTAYHDDPGYLEGGNMTAGGSARRLTAEASGLIPAREGQALDAWLDAAYEAFQATQNYDERAPRDAYEGTAFRPDGTGWGDINPGGGIHPADRG